MNLMFSLLTSGKYTGMRDKKDMDIVLRLIVLNITYFVASFVIIGMGVRDMQGGNIEHGLAMLIIGFLILLNLSLLRTELPFIAGGCILTALFGVFCGISIFAKDDMRGLSAVWIYLYPLMSVFTLGLRAGIIPALLLFVFVVVGTFTPMMGGFDYTITEAVLICGLYFFVMSLTAVYEFARSVKDRWLSRQDSYMNMVFRNSPDIIMIFDRNRKLVYCADSNGKFDDIYRKDFQEIFSGIIAPDELRDIAGRFLTAARHKKPVVFERTLNSGEESEHRHYEIHYTPMYDNINAFQGVFVLFHDMTEIIEINERLKYASLAKSNFLANMSHEIRTPLNAITGMTTIARNSADIDRKNYCLDKIEGASVILLGIINDILDMSKIEEGKLELFNTEFDFFAMIKRVGSIFEFRLNEKKQQFMINADSRIPARIITDEQRLAQVLTNLIGNAVKFTPNGGKISLDLKRTDSGIDPALCEIELRVTDSGPGILKEDQARLFQSFVQVDSSVSRKFGGTGLGLAISRKMMEMMKGSIRLESEPGEGSSFIVTINAEVPQSQAESKNGGVETFAEENAEEENYEGKWILLAEDVAINREIVITILEPLGFTVVEAEDGQRAFDIFRAAPENFDLIFMDIHMPGIDGYEATRLIRAVDHSRAKTIPIIAMTANVFREDVERCLAVGMDDHIGKPLDFNEVTMILRKYLRNSGS